MGVVASPPASTPLALPPLLPALKSCTSLGELRPLHALAIKTGRAAGDPLVAAEVLRCSSLSADRDLEYARKVFDWTPEPNVFCYNTLIRGFAESELQGREALLLFCCLLRDGGVRPNQHTFPSVLKACAAAGDAAVGKTVHSVIVKLGLGSDEFVLTNLARFYALCGFMADAERVVNTSSVSPECEAHVVMRNALIEGYFRLGMVRRAAEVFDAMHVRSIVTWNGMISHYVRLGRFKEAVETFTAMLSRGVEPNRVSFLTVLPAIARIGSLDIGEWVHDSAKRNGVRIDDVLGSALIDMYSKCGEISKAVGLFEELPRRSPITWHAMIAGLALHGRAAEALHYFSLMAEAAVDPTDVTFVAVLTACSHAGLINEGLKVLDDMVRVHKVTPELKHYTCVVDMLGRAGLLDEAEKLVNQMPAEPDDVVYKSLLAACRLHGNIDMAGRIVDRLLSLSPTDEACYVLMSNLYASLEEWDKVAGVRKRMKELDIQKDPGRSWIVLDGTTHEFVADDDIHPRKEEIQLKLEEMAARLRPAGTCRT